MLQRPLHIVIVGPAHPLRGGIAAFNERLATEFIKEGHGVDIYTFSYQYPSFLFPGKTQLTTSPKPEQLNIDVSINSINPLNWIKVGDKIRRAKPDIVIVRYWLPFMGPCLGTIIRRIKKNKHTKVICIADNITPHEKRPGDGLFTRYFIKPVDAFIVMSKEVMQQLIKLDKDKTYQLIPHPLYDHFGPIITREEARNHLGIDNDAKVLLFFGFIRKYKGLDLLLKALQMLIKKPENINLKLLIAGEFYEDRKNYQSFFDNTELSGHIILHDQFIADDEVKYYLCAADVTVQPYRSATQSGVTPLSYHFEIPMVVTNVGGLPDMVSDGVSGIVVAPNPDTIAEGIEHFFARGENHFLKGLRQQKLLYQWSRMTKGILELYGLKKK